MRSVVTFAALAFAAALLVPRYVAPMKGGAHPAPALMTARPAAPAQPEVADSRAVVVQRGPNGHFQVQGRVDGRLINFLIDTGASVIALNESDAAMLGIHPAQSEYTALVKTANGVARAAPTELDLVEIDDLMVRDVDAMVMPDGALSDNLLGMSFLNKLRRFEVSNGRMVLEQ
jgi:aspartyl protease family protein